MKRKFLSLALVLVMALTLLPTGVLAADNAVTKGNITLSNAVITDEYGNLFDDFQTGDEADKAYYDIGIIGFWDEGENLWGYSTFWTFLLPSDAAITGHLSGNNKMLYVNGYKLEESDEGWNAVRIGSYSGDVLENQDYALTVEKIRKEIPGAEYLECCVGDPTLDDWSQNEWVEIKIVEKSSETPSNPTSSTPSFTDVAPGAYYADPVAWAVTKGITSGKSATIFAPGETCTRGQILTFLWRSQGSVTSKAANPFGEQVSTSAYYYPALLWAYENGLLQEYNRSKFNPNEPCTRSDATLFMWHVAGKPSVIGSSRLTDLPTDGGRKQAIIWALSENITQGTTETTFSPDNICTRGQIVTFLYRAYAK